MNRKISIACLAVALWCHGPAGSGPASAAPPQARLTANLQPLPAEAWSASHARHLLFRAGFGGDHAQVQRLYAAGLARAIDELVDVAAVPALDLPPPSASQPPEPPGNLAKLTPPERQKVNAQRRRDDQQRLAELRRWWIQRMTQSPRPLEEKMTLFWHGLFTSGYQTVRSSLAMYGQNELFRRHAVGNYGELLSAIIRDGAMLRYLDNNSNVKGRPNENLAREILELFSMGEGNYSEQDIKQAARALTGYGYDRNTWEFRFNARLHDDTDKTIFGQTGNWDGDKLVELILHQPATARYVVHKLFVFYVHDDPDEATIEELARTFREADYEIAPLLKTLFASEEFYSPRALATHIKSPVELVVGTIRTLPVQRVDHQALAVALRNMGQDLFEPPNVKGWDGGRTWLNSNWLFARQNFAAALVDGAGMGRGAAGRGKRDAAASQGLNLTTLCQAQGLTTPAQIVDRFSRTLFAVPLSAQQRSELLAALGDLPLPADWQKREAQINAQLQRLILLMLSMPQYQLS